MVLMRMLFMAHSGLRYLVLLVGVVSIFYFIWSVVSKNGNDRLGKILGSTFVGLLDLQLLLGISMVVLGNFYPALIGHLVMMLGAVAVGHVAMAMAKNTQPVERRPMLRLIGVVVPLLLIIAGVAAIGRSLLGTGVPSYVG
jgi:hypothetical protein